MRAARVLVVDDEPLARRRLLRLLDGRPDALVVGEARDGEGAVRAISRLSPDLIFLDIQMPGWSGIQVLEEIRPEVVAAVVFVTGYDQFALDAFDLHAVDYLLKPFTDERFERALERALGRLRRSAVESVAEHLMAVVGAFRDRGSPGEERSIPVAPLPVAGSLPVRLGGKVRILRPEEIDWIEASGSLVRLHLGKRCLLVRESMASLVARLPSPAFMRIHRSTAVNLDRVVEVLPLTHREQVLVLRDGTRLKLSRTYRDELEARLRL